MSTRGESGNLSKDTNGTKEGGLIKTDAEKNFQNREKGEYDARLEKYDYRMKKKRKRKGKRNLL